MNMMTKPPAKFKVKKKPAKSLQDRVYQIAEVSQAPDVAVVYDALFGAGRPIDDLLATNEPMLRVMLPILSSDLSAHLRANPSPVGRQIIRAAVTPGSDASISIPALRKAAKSFELAKIDVVATVGLQMVPSAGDPNDVGIAVELHVLFFGPGADAKLAAKVRKARPIPGVVRSAVEWISPDDSAALDEALKAMLLPGSTRGPLKEHFDDNPVPPNWNDSRERAKRAHLTFMANAQLPLKSMFVTYGAGKVMVSHALGDANRLNGIACKAGPPAIHRDGIPHFLFKELRRLGLDNINVPLVMLR